MSDHRRWVSRAWIPLGGWGAAFPRGLQQSPPKAPPGLPHPSGFDPTRPPLGWRPPKPVMPPNRLIKGGPSAIDLFLWLIFSLAVAGLIVFGLAVAGRAEAGELTCVALSSTGPGVGTVESKILWSGWACEGDDGLWRWSHPASWDPVTVSETPPVASVQTSECGPEAIDCGTTPVEVAP